MLPELLDMIILVADLEQLTGNKNVPGEGLVIESNRDVKKGISATCIIKNGTIEKGMYVVSGTATAPVRIMENYLGKPLSKASFSSPVKIIGWDELPLVGNIFKTFANREEARAEVEKNKILVSKKTEISATDDASINNLLLIIKADTGSSLEAILGEIKKLKTERIATQVISSGIGGIGENDVRLANGTKKAIVIGFNTKVDALAKSLAERNSIEIETFDIIYKMSEWLKKIMTERAPKIQVDESTGMAKVLKIFSKVKTNKLWRTSGSDRDYFWYESKIMDEIRKWQRSRQRIATTKE